MPKKNSQVVDKMIKELDRIDEIQEINRQIQKNFKQIALDNTRYSRNENTHIDLEAERYMPPIGATQYTRVKYFRQLAQYISEMRGEDIRKVIVKKLVEMGLGDKQKGDKQILMYLLDRFADRNDDAIPEFTIANDDMQWDTPQSIDEMAGRILYLMSKRYITINVAERMLNLLKQKVSFIETGVIVKKLDELEKTIASQSRMMTIAPTNSPSLPPPVSE